MTLRMLSGVTLLAVSLAGCTATRPQGRHAGSVDSHASLLSSISAATDRARGSLQQLLEADSDVEPPRWDWAAAMPLDVPRSELVAASVPGDALAFLAPAPRQQDIQLVSAPAHSPHFRVVNIDGHPVRSCADVFRAMESTESDAKRIQVDVLNQAAPPGSSEVAIEIAADKALALSHLIASDQPAMRMVEDGNTWIVFRENGVHCKLLARVERSRGLLHIVLTVANAWGDAKSLPVEVRAVCDEQPLRSLSVAETLDVLYSEQKADTADNMDVACSFAGTSEREDYLVPANYSRIERQMHEKFHGSISQPVSAFASVPGFAYPGPAALADARALSGFLMQRQLCRPGGPANAGWIIFAGSTLQDGGAIEVSIDLGNGPKQFRYHVPSP